MKWKTEDCPEGFADSVGQPIPTMHGDNITMLRNALKTRQMSVAQALAKTKPTPSIAVRALNWFRKR
jgi:hypothetical protein